MRDWPTDVSGDISSSTPTNRNYSPTNDPKEWTEAGVVSLVANGSDIHLLWAYDTDSDLFSDFSTDNGATWDAETEELTATVLYIAAAVYERSGTKIGYLYDDATDLKYNEIDLGGGGTQTDKAVTYTGTGSSAAVVLDVGKLMTSTGTGAVAFSRDVSFGRSYTYGGTGTSGVVKDTAKSFTYTGTGGATALQAAIKFVTAVISAVGTASRTVKDIATSYSTTGSGTVVFSRIASFFRSFSPSGTGTSVFSKVRNRFKSFTYTGTGEMSFAKTLVKFVTATMTGTGAVAFSKVRSRFMSATMTGLGSAAITKSTSLFKTMTGLGTVTKNKWIQLSDKAITGVGTLVQDATKVFLRALSYAGTGTASTVSTTRNYVRSFASAGAGAASRVIKDISAGYTMTATGGVSFSKVRARLFSSVFTGTGTVVADAEITLIEQLLTFTGSGTAALVKQIGKLFTPGGVGSPTTPVKDVSVEKVLGGTGTAEVDPALAANETRTFTGSGALAAVQQFMGATTSAVGTAIRGFFAGLGRWF
jgi:hypothetical protein